MRRDDLEVGVSYLGPASKRYEIVDLTPGWRIGFNLDWIRDDSVRQRTMKGKKVSFRKNNALRALRWDDDTPTKVVITPNRLVGPWDRYEATRQLAEKQEQLAALVAGEVSRLLAEHGQKLNRYQVTDDGQSMIIPIASLLSALGITLVDEHD